MRLSCLLAALVRALESDDAERSLLDGSELIGDFNFRTNQFDCGTDPGGFYEDDL